MAHVKVAVRERVHTRRCKATSGVNWSSPANHQILRDTLKAPFALGQELVDIVDVHVVRLEALAGRNVQVAGDLVHLNVAMDVATGRLEDLVVGLVALALALWTSNPRGLHTNTASVNRCARRDGPRGAVRGRTCSKTVASGMDQPFLR